MSGESVVERQLALAVGHRLRTLRQGLGLSQEQFAQRAGISRNQYQLLEAGLSDRARRHPVNPQLTTLIGVARAHGMPTSELVARILDEQPAASGEAPPNVAPVSPTEHGAARKTDRRTAAPGTPSPPTGSSPPRRTRS